MINQFIKFFLDKKGLFLRTIEAFKWIHCSQKTRKHKFHYDEVHKDFLARHTVLNTSCSEGEYLVHTQHRNNLRRHDDDVEVTLKQRYYDAVSLLGKY